MLERSCWRWREKKNENETNVAEKRQMVRFGLSTSNYKARNLHTRKLFWKDWEGVHCDFMGQDVSHRA